MKDVQTLEAAVSAAEISREMTMDELMELFSMPSCPTRNSLVRGEVVLATRGGFLVSLGQKSDSFVREDEAGDIVVGGTYDFWVIEEADEDGASLLSRKRAKVWGDLSELKESGRTAVVKVGSLSVMKPRDERKAGREPVVAGLNVYLDGVRGFLPRAELAFRGPFEELLGQELEVKVIDADPNKGRAGTLILSQKQAVDESQGARIAELSQGDIVEGVVSKIIEVGALVDIGGGLTGLVFRTELSGNRHAKPVDVVSAGEGVRVQVLNVDHERRRVSLSLRSVRQSEFLEGIEVGDTLEGVIARFEQYGAFVQLADCIDGLLHVSDFATEGGEREKLETGATIQVKVRAVDRERRRVSLSRREFGNS